MFLRHYHALKHRGLLVGWCNITLCNVWILSNNCYKNLKCFCLAQSYQELDVLLLFTLQHPDIVSCTNSKIQWRKLIPVHFTLSVALSMAICISVWMQTSGRYKFFWDVLFFKPLCITFFGAGIKCPMWGVGDQNLSGSWTRWPLNGCHTCLTYGMWTITLWGGCTWC